MYLLIGTRTRSLHISIGLGPQPRISNLPTQRNTRMSHQPNSHTNDHWQCIKTIKPRFSSKQIASPSLRKFYNTINSTNDYRSIRNDYCGNEHLELDGFREGSRKAFGDGVEAGAPVEEVGYESEDHISEALENDPCFLHKISTYNKRKVVREYALRFQWIHRGGILQRRSHPRQIE